MTSFDGLKICFLAGTLGQGGAERQLFYQLETLKSRGAEPSVVCLANGEFWQNRIEALGIPVIGLKLASSRLDRLKQVISYGRRFSPDIIQSAHFYTNLYAWIAARALRTHAIGTVRSNGIQDLHEVNWPIGTMSMRLPDYLLINSRPAIQTIIRLGHSGHGIWYLPNAVDADRFVPVPRKTRQEFHIVMVGRLTAPKRFDIFLRVLSRVRGRGDTKIVGHIVGDGPDGQSLRHQAELLGLDATHLCFHGSVMDVVPLYQEADLCLHLSDWEGMPNTILEAMACGLPVIASPVGGIPELVQDRITGVLVETNDESCLIDTVQELYENQSMRLEMGTASRRFIEENHTLEKLRASMEDFYGNVLANSR